MGKIASHSKSLPKVPDKRYFSIGEAGELCGVKNHVLRYWEQVFPQLNPLKRRGNRRYYRYEDILLIREIRELLYIQGFTVNGAKQMLKEEKKSFAKKSMNVSFDQLITELSDVVESLR